MGGVHVISRSRVGTYVAWWTTRPQYYRDGLVIACGSTYSGRNAGARGCYTLDLKKANVHKTGPWRYVIFLHACGKADPRFENTGL